MIAAKNIRRPASRARLAATFAACVFGALGLPGMAAGLAQEAYLKAGANTQDHDFFGQSVATSDNTVAVGAFRGGSVPGNRVGQVHVYVRSGPSWSLEAIIQSPHPDANDSFGWDLDLEGDTLAVGVRSESSAATGVNGNGADNSAASSGAVYVFVRSGASWTQEAYLKASNAQAGDQFGTSVALSGNTLVVGAHLEDSAAAGVGGNQADNSAISAGAAYVFKRTGSSWSQEAYLKASNSGAADFFGWSVAIAGDTAVVGAIQEDSAASGVNGNQADNSRASAGAAYVFVRSGSIWSQQAYLKASYVNAGHFFGESVTIDGDLVVIGAHREDSNAVGIDGNGANTLASDSGAAYVFVRQLGTWSQEAFLKASNAEAGDRFGGSVDLSGHRLAVGAIWESSNATGVGGNQSSNAAFNSGAAYLFERAQVAGSPAWSQTAYVKASNPGGGIPDPDVPEEGDTFGKAVALSSSLLAVGAPLEDSSAVLVNGDQQDNSAIDAGAAYVFAFPPETPSCFADDYGDDQLDAGWTLVHLGNADQGQAVETGGRLQLTGDGTVFFAGPTDNGVYLRRPAFAGDFRAELEVTGFPGDFGGPYRKLGLMARASDAANAARVFLAYVPDWENSGRPVLQFRYRSATGAAGDGALGSNIYDLQLPLRIALERSGNTFRVFYKPAGSSLWRQPRGGSQGSITLPSFGSASALIGPLAVSYDANVVVTAEAEDFSLCPLSAPPGFAGGPPPKVEPDRPGDREKPPAKW